MKECLFGMFNSDLDEKNVFKIVEEKLKEKYNTSFVVKKIGNRYGTGKYDEATLFCSPSHDKNMVFTVTYNMVNKFIVSDDYYIKTSCAELEKQIDKNLKNSVTKVELFGKNISSKAYSIREIIDEYPNCKYIITTVSNEKIDVNVFNEILNNIKNTYNGISAKVLLYVASKDDFAEIQKEAEMVPELSEAYIEKHNVSKQYIIDIKDNNIMYL